MAGVTTGLLELEDEVTFRGRHFGFWWQLTSKITALERPAYFRDVQVLGPFAWMEHDHNFEELGEGTRMVDRFAFEAPWGFAGQLVSRTLLKWHLRGFLEQRAAILRKVAEAGRI